jgi:hypothetical protein
MKDLAYRAIQAEGRTATTIHNPGAKLRIRGRVVLTL